MPTAPGPSAFLLIMTTSAWGLPRKSRRCTDTFSWVLGAVISCLLRVAGASNCCLVLCSSLVSGSASHQWDESVRWAVPIEPLRCSKSPKCQRDTELIGRWLGHFSGLVVAVRPADPVVSVSQLVLGDVRSAVVRREHQVLVEHNGPE